jgi:hypothetical protein
MSFLRSLSVFLLSLIFTSAIFIAVSSSNLLGLIQKDSIKTFLSVEGAKFIGEQCQSDCSNNENPATCVQLCESTSTSQTDALVNNAVDDLYQHNFFGMNLNDITYFFSQYVLLAAIGLIAGVMLFVASETPLSTVGKDIITIAVSLFISSFSTYFVIGFSNVPIEIEKIFSDYFYPAFRGQIIYGIVFLAAGLILLVANRYMHRKTAFIEKVKKAPRK